MLDALDDPRLVVADDIEQALDAQDAVAQGVEQRSDGIGEEDPLQRLVEGQGEAVDVRVVAVEPIFYTMTTTFAGSPALARFTRRTTRAIGKLAARPATAWTNHLSGAALYAADGLLARRGHRGPSLNLLVAVKDGDDAAAP